MTSSEAGLRRTEHARPVVVDAKVRAPPFRGLVRRRCCELLGRLNGRRLALVLAPAGFGKTTLLAQFADVVVASSGDPVAWYRAEVTDAKRDIALAHLERALQVAIPSLPGKWESVADAAAALERCAHDRVVLVLDDFHQLVGTGAEEMFARFFDLAPPSLCVVMASRQAPHFDSSRLQLLDALLEIGPGDLRFRSWETEQLFRDLYGEPLPHEDITTLTRGIGGWAAGLQLFHLATRGKPLRLRREAVHRLQGRSSVAREYLARNVVGGLPEPLQRFVTATSVLPRLDGALCDRFLGKVDSVENLTQLAHRQLVTREADGSFRCHDVLRAHLQVLLAEESGEVALRRAFRRAGRLLERNGWPGEAFLAYLGAGDLTAVTHVLGDHGESIEARARPVLDQLPQAFVDSEPWLLLAAARRDLANGDLSGAASHFRRAEAGFVDHAAAAACRREQLGLRAWLEPRLNPSSPSWMAVLRRATRRNPRGAVEELSGDDAAVHFARGIAALLAGDIELASRCFVAARDLGDASPIVVVCAKLAIGFTSHLDGLDLVRYADELTDEAEALDVPAFSRLARALPALTGSSDAIREADTVETECERAGDLWGAALVSVFSGCGRARVGDSEGEEAFHLAAERFRALDAEVVAEWVLRSALAGRARIEVDPPQAPTDSASSETVIRCFGRFSVTVAGHELDLAAVRPRARSTFRLLALHAGEPQHWELLVEALWPDRSPTTARRSLQVTISELRHLLHASGVPRAALMISREGQSYRLKLGPDATVDVVSFHALLQDAERERRAGNKASTTVALQRALDLYSGGLLPEEGPADWVVQARDRHRLLVTDAAQLLAGLRLDAGDAQGAVAAAEAGLRRDRFHDALWRLLIAAHDTAGERAAAARARHAYDEVLLELGLSPTASSAVLTTSTV